MSARLAAIGRHPWRALGAMSALLVAVGSVAGSSALFTTQTVNPNNTFSAGILDVSSDPGDGQAILTAADLVPGDSANGSVTITNDGTVDGSNWKLEQAVATSVAGDDPDSEASAELKDALTLTVTTGDTPVYSGPLTGLSSVDLAAVPAGESRTYDFAVTFAAGSDDGYQGSSVSTSYTWSASAGE